jgi:hypothetical protein
MKESYGIDPWAVIIECAYGQWNGYTFGIEKDAINSWINDEGNRDRLFSPIDRGAIACSHGYCSFIGFAPHAKLLTKASSPVFIQEEPLESANVTVTTG